MAPDITELLPFTHARSESINTDSLNSNFLQLRRRSGGRPQRTVYPRQLPFNTVIHDRLTGIEPTTFRLLVRRATSSATDSPYTVKYIGEKQQKTQNYHSWLNI